MKSTFTVRFTNLELAFFFKQLHYLTGHGISLYPAIELIYADVGSRSLKQPIEILLDSLREGESFSTILHEKIGIPLFISNIIRVGENEGSLVNSLEKASQYLENRIELRRKVQTALTYPILLILLGSAVLVWVMTQILPHFKMIYQDAGIVLPLPTRILFKLHDIVLATWWQFPLILIILAGLIYLFFRKELPYLSSKYIYRVPVIGTFRYYFSLMNFVSNIGSLHSSGISVIKSLQLTIEATNNLYFKSLLRQTLTQVIEGQKLSAALHQTGFFPAIVIRMMMAGEESAELDQILLQLTEYLGQELDAKLKQFIALIGPVSLIIIGFFVTFISVSFLLPLFRMTGVLHQGY